MKAFLHNWQFDLSSLALLVLLVVYGVTTKSLYRNLCFAVALLIAVICFFSPLAVLSSHYLFSAHMTVHVLLLLIVGPLLVLGLPSNKKQFEPLFLFLKNHPVLGWLTGLGVMWFWHLPVLFNAVMNTAHQSSFSPFILLEGISLIAAGILFAAPVVHPNKAYRISALEGVIYLFTACIGCSLLGLLITFAPTGTYHHFLSRHDGFGFNNVILHRWHLTQAIDQQAAGLVMWVPCCLVYVSGAMYLLVQWFAQKEDAIAYSK